MMSKKNKPISAKKGKPSKQSTDKGQSISKRDILRIARLVFEQNDGRVLTYKQVCHAFGKTNMGTKRPGSSSWISPPSAIETSVW